MNAQQILDVPVQNQEDVSAIDASRILFILHPNVEYVKFVLSDRVINREKYVHTRDTQPVGAEKKLLDYLNDCVVGIEKAQAGKNSIELEISPGILPKEYVPLVVRAIIEWGRAAEGTYEPTLYCEDRRWAVSPTYSRDGWTETGGIKVEPGKVNLGLPYKVWLHGE